MSSTRQASSSSSNFQLIINALADYAKLTGIDLTKSLSAEKIECSNSPEAILELLQEQEKAFKEYREVGRRLISCLNPTIKVLHAFSGILGEAVSMVSVTCHPVSLLTWPRQVPLSPAKAVFTSIDVLLAVRPLSTRLNQDPCNNRLCQAASGVTSSYDALLELFECLGNFLKRLEIYITIPPTTMMSDIIIKIMVEVLSVLALATKQIEQGRFSKCAVTYTLPMAHCAIEKFAKKLLGESEVEAVLHKLDRLTQDEARMTVTQTLGVVHGLVGNVRVVMDGTQCFA
jgi:fungal STAND N-terminal Goodbye domain